MPTHARNASFLADGSPYAADGLHFTVEWKPLNETPALWKRIELSWEIPEPLTTDAEAEVIARTLALRFDGKRVYRVVDPNGNVLRAFVVQKRLLEERPTARRQVPIPPDVAIPLLSEVLPPKR